MSTPRAYDPDQPRNASGDPSAKPGAWKASERPGGTVGNLALEPEIDEVLAALSLGAPARPEDHERTAALQEAGSLQARVDRLQRANNLLAVSTACRGLQSAGVRSITVVPQPRVPSGPMLRVVRATDAAGQPVSPAALSLIGQRLQEVPVEAILGRGHQDAVIEVQHEAFQHHTRLEMLREAREALTARESGTVPVSVGTLLDRVRDSDDLTDRERDWIIDQPHSNLASALTDAYRGEIRDQVEEAETAVADEALDLLRAAYTDRHLEG